MTRVYWSDREGNLAPLDSTFHTRAFVSSTTRSYSPEFVQIPQAISYRPLKKSFFPNHTDWKKGVEKALDLIGKNALQKVVLGRKCVLEFDRELDPFALSAALKEKMQGSFIFCIQSDVNAFLGASPERLFKREDGFVVSEAIAGTRARGREEIEDRALKNELLCSAKDLREFLPLQTYIQNALIPLSDHFPHCSPISVHQTHNVQHLYSCISAKLKANITDEQILSQLHPTPALCGLPSSRAKELIAELEPFERGLYGGVIGWTTPQKSDWIVGIRSCLIEKTRATLFSAAGIVEGSDADAEWEELNQKIKLYDGILDY